MILTIRNRDNPSRALDVELDDHLWAELEAFARARGLTIDAAVSRAIDLGFEEVERILWRARPVVG